MKLTLRDYQKNALQETWEALARDGSPILFNSSVGSGKSLMIAVLLKKFQILGKYVLCITHNAQLVANNAHTYLHQGGKCGIRCSGINRKEFERYESHVEINRNEFTHTIIYATAQSILSDLKRKKDLSKVLFNMIVIDEGHMVNMDATHSAYIKILNHYKFLYPPMRILGLTGTPFRFNGKSIVGDDKLYQKQVANITLVNLIQRGFLVPPNYQCFSDAFDFDSIKTPAKGFFKGSDLEEVIHKKPRLTAAIMQALVNIVDSQQRNGAFIFASTVNHVHECMRALPPNESAYITSDTTPKERTDIINKARDGKLKYLVNVNVFTVGIDIPRFDTVCFVRPTESLVLLVQMIGRGLRLFSGKKDCIILDAAGNLKRHSDWDDPIILDAIKKNTKPEEAVIPCFTCGAMNTIHARRCIGVTDKGRCDYYFNFKECILCKTPNDITARHCRTCKVELIDPNTKLDLTGLEKIETYQVKASILISTEPATTCLCTLTYYGNDNLTVSQSTRLDTPKKRNIFYHKIVKTYYPDHKSEFWQALKSDALITNLTSLLNNIPCRIPKFIFLDPATNRIKYAAFY